MTILMLWSITRIHKHSGSLTPFAVALLRAIAEAHTVVTCKENIASASTPLPRLSKKAKLL